MSAKENSNGEEFSQQFQPFNGTPEGMYLPTSSAANLVLNTNGPSTPIEGRGEFNSFSGNSVDPRSLGIGFTANAVQSGNPGLQRYNNLRC